LKEGGAAAPAAAEAPKKPDPAKKKSGLFGVGAGELPSLFGSSEESLAMRPDELFADAIPSAPGGGMDDLDVPIDVAPAPGRKSEDEISDDDLSPAADEGGGVAVPTDSDDVVANATDQLAVPSVTDNAAARGDAVPATGDNLISMDDIFSSSPRGGAEPPSRGPTKAEELPAFGVGGVLPAPFLKPAPEPAAEPGAAISLASTDDGEDAPAEKPEPTSGPAAPASSGGPVPFALIPVEGITDARFDLPGGGVYLLGRDKDAQVKILSTSVSRRHARIDASGADHVLIDLGSANGTQVNGQSVARQPLKDGDLIRMGKVILRYVGPLKA
jgi:hypothetical protein